MAYNAARHEALVVDGRMVSPHEVVTGQRMRTTRDLLGFSELPASQAELIRDMFYSVSRDNARTAIAHDHAERAIPASVPNPHRTLGLGAAVRVLQRRCATDHKSAKSLLDKYSALGVIDRIREPIGTATLKSYDVIVGQKRYSRIHRDFLKHYPSTLA